MQKIVAIVAEKLYAGSRGRVVDWQKILRIIYSLSVFSLGCIKTQWGDAHKFGTIFFAHLSHVKHHFFVCRYVEPFRSYALPTDGGSAKVRRNLRFPQPNFRDGLKNNSQVFSGLTPHQTCVHILWRSVEGRLRSTV